VKISFQKLPSIYYEKAIEQEAKFASDMDSGRVWTPGIFYVSYRVAERGNGT
jgi:hypothetical protein